MESIKTQEPKTQISASVKNKTIDEINKMAAKEERTFSTMIDKLLEEAIASRKKKNKK